VTPTTVVAATGRGVVLLRGASMRRSVEQRLGVARGSS
jgi:hypothetical protein